MERRDRVAERIEQCRSEPTVRRDCVEEVVGRNARHAQHPVDHRALTCFAKTERATRATHDRHDIAVQAGRHDAVQLQFA